MAKPKIKNTITKKEWNKKHNALFNMFTTLTM